MNTKITFLFFELHYHQRNIQVIFLGIMHPITKYGFDGLTASKGILYESLL